MPDRRCSIPSDSDKTRQQGRDLHRTDRIHIQNMFKICYNQHTHSFRHDQKRNQTALSKYIWTLKDKNIDYTINWRIVARGRAYTASTKSCRLCRKEKYFIIFKPQMATLNIINELGSECRHRKKHLLCNA